MCGNKLFKDLIGHFPYSFFLSPTQHLINNGSSWVYFPSWTYLSPYELSESDVIFADTPEAIFTLCSSKSKLPDSFFGISLEQRKQNKQNHLTKLFEENNKDENKKLYWNVFGVFFLLELLIGFFSFFF